MPTYLTPGVYVEEVPSGTRPIEAVGTSTAAFLGVAPDPQAHVGEAVAINNPSQFRSQLVGGASVGTPLSHAVFGFFANGGSRCYVVNLGTGGTLIGSGGRRRGGLQLLEATEEVKIVAAPGYADARDYDALLSHCEAMGDRVAVLDPPAEVDDVDRLKEVAAATSRPVKDAEGDEAKSRSRPGLRPRNSDRGFGAFYFPWITIADPLDPRTLVDCPPCGHVAGIYARTDAARGVHKAPANELVRGALNVTYRVTQGEQGELNRSGVNCIRFFHREGIRVWGARTLAESASEWRYLSVRRLFNMVEESIARSTRWVVFEPNDRSLWQSIKRDVKAFLLQLWRDGALMGRTPEEAFFVQCDEETNPPESIDQGRVVTLIGLAPVKPAEFVIFRIGQTAAGAEIETEGD
jgi:Bacteriophage tail sheath protein